MPWVGQPALLAGFQTDALVGRMNGGSTGWYNLRWPPYQYGGRALAKTPHSDIAHQAKGAKEGVTELQRGTGICARLLSEATQSFGHEFGDWLRRGWRAHEGARPPFEGDRGWRGCVGARPPNVAWVHL